MSLTRRQFLLALGAIAGGTSLVGVASRRHWQFDSSIAASLSQSGSQSSTPPIAQLKFQPVRTPMPLAIDGLTAKQQVEAYQTYEVVDDLVLPPGYTYDVLASWGDRVGDSRYGYNNDYVSFVATGPDEGLLTVNFEYLSGQTWLATYSEVIGELAALQSLLSNPLIQRQAMNAFLLANSDPLKQEIAEISRAGMIDQGIGVLSVRRTAEGRWERTYSDRDRRITGISGLDDGRYLKATGPATAIFNKPNKLGYDDGLGDKIIGTFQNCAGGTTPWGTVLSAEENFQSQVPELVMRDGSSLPPGAQPFAIAAQGLASCANVFGLAGNKYGWMVEIDPNNPDDYGTKHTWLGRYRHEAVAFRAIADKPLAVYSGCDRPGGHLYKFVSQASVQDPTDPQNSELFKTGTLYGAQFNPDGTGRWLALEPGTPVAPLRPSQVFGAGGVGRITLPNPDAEGAIVIESDTLADRYRKRFSTLSDLYVGETALEKQGAILIDAHYAANAAGITATARPEDTEVDPQTGTLYISFTSGQTSRTGGPDRQIFHGAEGEISLYGWIMALNETDADPASLSFTWEMLAVGGEPSRNGLGFSNPDNLAIDAQANVWCVTDISSSLTNRAVSDRLPKTGTLNLQQQLATLGQFGNNTTWVIPTQPDQQGFAYPFAIGPMECELTGLYFTPDQKQLFLSVQHPGEINGTRQNNQMVMSQFELQTPDGRSFTQQRQVPLGSNWPDKQLNAPPKPSLVVIRREDQTLII
ncbi:MAG: alkaline phosphatase PhoX [Cyanobacteria bacterium P01_H01_bin.121]